LGRYTRIAVADLRIGDTIMPESVRGNKSRIPAGIPSSRASTDIAAGFPRRNPGMAVSSERHSDIWLPRTNMAHHAPDPARKSATGRAAWTAVFTPGEKAIGIGQKGRGRYDEVLQPVHPSHSTFGGTSAGPFVLAMLAWCLR